MLIHEGFIKRVVQFVIDRDFVLCLVDFISSWGFCFDKSVVTPDKALDFENTWSWVL